MMFDPTTLIELLSYRASRQPEHLAYRFLAKGDVSGESSTRTFSRLELRARAIGAWLQENGYAGQRALLLFPPGIDFIESFWGCLFGGVIAVPTFPPRSERTWPRLSAIIANAKPSLILATASIANSTRNLSKGAADLTDIRWQVSAEIDDDAAARWTEPGITADSIAFLQYTSGSTSSPKGVMVSHANLLANERAVAHTARHTPEDLTRPQRELAVSWLPLEHDLGLIGGVLQGVYIGGTTTLMSPLHFLQKPFRWLQAISHFRAHTSGGPNFAYELCISKAQANPALLQGLDLSSWRSAVNGAEPVRWETLQRFAETFAPCGFNPEAFVPCYGMAETTLVVSGRRRQPLPSVLRADPDALLHGRAEPSSNGRALVSCGCSDEVVKIVDPQLRVERAEGEVGEIWIHGPSVAQGYWQDPENTARTFGAKLRGEEHAARSYVRSGDLGFVSGQELFITGRLKDLLIVDGTNHYPQDLEYTVEAAHPAVRQAGVAAFALDTAAGERPAVIAEVKLAKDADPEPIIAAIRGAVSDVHGVALCAVALLRPQSLLKTSSGKVQRSACRAAFQRGQLEWIARRDFVEILPAQPAQSLTAAEPAGQTEPLAQPAPRARPLSATGQNPAIEPAAPAEPLPNAETEQPLTAAELAQLRDLLLDSVAARARIPRAEVDSHRPLSELGFGSRELVELTSVLSESLGRELSPALFYDHPSIAEVLRHLEGAGAAEPVSSQVAQQEPIAIVSMACRFPGDIDTPEALWRVLAEGRDLVERFPEGRWDVDALYDPDPDAAGKCYTREGALLREIDRFDAEFFDVPPREARAMDPQQRLLLEVAWEALERAGIVPASLHESVSGVYVGMFDSGYLEGSSLEQLDGYFGTGSIASAASGRIAYTLGLQGPAVTVDTACSASLVAVHLAAQALRAGECDLALAGGVSLMVTPRLFVEFSRARGLSPSGRCKAFSDDADGANWGEGCGMLVLKRLRDAERDGDRVLATIRGSAVNQDGRSQGLTAPHGPAQERLIRRALEASGLAPADIDYVEAHGTGTKLGDPIEAGALARVFGPARPSAGPLWLGSLKSNLAHTQAAAGVAGIMKVVLSLQHEQLPKTLHVAQPTRHVNWDASGLALVTEPRPWPRGSRTRRAGVSAFGVSGTNAHVVLEEPQPLAATPRLAAVETEQPRLAATEAEQSRLAATEAEQSRLAGTETEQSRLAATEAEQSRLAGTETEQSRLAATEAEQSRLTAAQSEPPLPGGASLYLLSARSEAALRGQAARLRAYLEQRPDVALPDVALSLATRRSHFERRAAVVASDRQALLDALASLSTGESAASVVQSAERVLAAGKLAFVFPGQGSQWIAMGKLLLERSPVFARSLVRCDEALSVHTGWSVLELLRCADDPAALERIEVVQPALFSMMVSLAALWRALGVEPEAVIGHSQGELAAAYTAGALSLEDAAKVVALRSKILTRVVGLGASAAVEMPVAELEARLRAGWGERLAVAAWNGARSAVVSGDMDALEELLAQLTRENVFARKLRMTVASHSAAMDSLEQEVNAQLAGVHGRISALPMYSTVLAGRIAGDELSTHYWFRNLREPVRFAQTLERLIADGYRTFLEVSPHPLLSLAVESAGEAAQTAVRVVGSLRRDEDADRSLKLALGKLHVTGRVLPLRELTPPGAQPLLDLPTYAFDRQRYWLEPEKGASAVGLSSSDHPLLGAGLESPRADRHVFVNSVSRRSTRWLAHYGVFGEVLVSGATILELCRSALQRARPGSEWELAQLELLAPLVLPEQGRVQLQLELTSAASGELNLALHSRPEGELGAEAAWTLHATALGVAVEPNAAAADPLVPSWPSDADELWDADAYTALAARGLQYGEAFRCVRSALRLGPDSWLLRVSLPAALVDSDDEGYGVHPALLEAPLQAAAALGAPESDSTRVWLPAGIERSALANVEARALTVQLERTHSVADGAHFDVSLWDEDGLWVGRLNGVSLRPASRASLSSATPQRALFEVAWRSVPYSPAAQLRGAWALVADADGGEDAAAIEELAAAITAAGIVLTRCEPGAELPSGLDKVLRLWPSAAPADVPARTCALTTEGLSELQSALTLTAAAPELVWLTRGALCHTPEGPSRLWQAGLWGLARSARTEHPQLGLRLIDLDPAASDPTLIVAALAHGDEPELSLRGSELRAPRLMHTELDQSAQPAYSVPQHGTLLITGGLGSLGVTTARWLAQRGAKRLLLTSRRGLADARVPGVIAELSALGAEVQVAACDVADRAALAALLAQLPADAPLCGIVHAAARIDDALLADQSAEHIARVMAPKVWGAWNLHELTAGMSLPLFVVYSSAAGVIGAAGRSNGAAASVFMDQLCVERRARGLAAISLSWGAWNDADQPRSGRQGMGALTPERAVALLEQALGHGAPHQVPWALQLGRLARSFDGEVPALWRELVQPARGRKPRRSSVAQGLARLPEEARRERVLSMLRQDVVHVLGLRNPGSLPADQPLRQLGLDSLMALELRNRIAARFACRLPATLLFDHPTLDKLTSYLLESVLDLAAAPLTAAAVRAPLAADEPIAIVSMACRLPGGIDSPESLWSALAEGRDLVEEFPAERWDVDSLYDPDPEASGKSYARQGGFIHGIDQFDAAFFEIAPREARAMDPQQRLLLETAWEALERAGIVPASLNESVTGVYIGAFDSRYHEGLTLAQLDGYVATGVFPSVASGRLAYTLGLQGPAITVDTACSSSLVAVHLASQALRSGECDLALAGGVSLLLTPDGFVEFSRLRGLSRSGRCKSFSDDADGAIWAEGCGLVVLKRLSDAQRDGDRVLAVLRGTAVNQDGRSQGLTAPNGPSQERVIRRALEAGRLAARDIDYVEAHGTGTTLGDPIEAGALAEVFGRERAGAEPLWLGSLKSNLAHTQAAAGIGGLIKVVLSLQHEQLPKTLHADKPTRHVDWEHSGLALVREPRAWPRGARVRRAGVSAFGLSGTNAHVVVEEAPTPSAAEATLSRGGESALPLLPLVVSGRDERALRAQAGQLASWLEAHPEVELRAVAQTAALHRTHFEQRAAVLASDVPTAVSALRALRDAQHHPALVQGLGKAARGGKLVFVFPGQGSQWPGMGRALLTESPTFERAVRACDAALQPWTGWSVLALLRGDTGPELPPLERVDAVQPALFALSVGLAAVWRELGIEPAAVVGHSQGEVSAAVVSGALSLEDGAKVVALRSQAVRKRSGQGGMLLIERPAAEVETFLAPYGSRLSIAAVNTASSTVVSGELSAIEALRSELSHKALFCRQVNVDYASHSAQMDELLPALAEALSSLRPRAGTIPLYSTVRCEPLRGEELDAAYWCRNLREPVRFDRALEQLLAGGHGVFVEVSAHPVLTLSLAGLSEQAGAVVVGSLQRERGELSQLLRSLGELHVQGQTLPWRKLAQVTGESVLPLPTYAFQRQRYWLEAVPQLTAAGLTASEHPLLGAGVQAARADRWLFLGSLGRHTAKWLPDHALQGEVSLSGTTLLELCHAALQRARPEARLDVSQLELLAPALLPEHGRLQLQVDVAESASGMLEVAVHTRPEGDAGATWTLHATAIGAERTPAAEQARPAPHWPAAVEEHWAEDTYERLERLGLHYGPAFRGVRSAVRVGPDAVLARVSLPDTLAEEAAHYGLHPALLDAATQAALALGELGEAVISAGVERWSLVRSGARSLRVLVTQTARSAEGARLQLSLWDEQGAWVGELSGLDVRRVSREKLRHRPQVERDFYEVAWHALPPAAADGLSGTWALISDAESRGEAEQLRARLTAAGLDVVALGPGAALPSGIAKVLRLWPSEARGGLANLANQADQAEALCVRALHELQAAVASAAEGGRAPEWLWLTQGAVASAPEEGVPSLSQAGLWGLARSARAEHPELGLRTIDRSEADDALLLAALATQGEPELALRGGQLRAPRLVRADVAPVQPPSAAPSIPQHGTLLISGGLSGLGLTTARWLAERGAKRLLLISRQGPSDPSAETAISLLSALGAEVQVAACDVTDRAALAALLAEIPAHAPLRGVVHCAMVLDNGLFVDQSAERFSRVLRPKVHGAWNLHELTRDLPLELFVVYSSAAGVAGSPGQTNYAAANAFLDQLCYERHSCGLPATSLAWGVWSEVGLAAKDDDNLTRYDARGYAPITLAHGLAMLELALLRSRRAPHQVLWTLRPARLQNTFGVEIPAMWRTLVQPKAALVQQRSALAESLASLSPAARHERVVELLCEDAAGVLGLRSAAEVRSDQPLRQLGLDSLMALELRNRIGARFQCRLSPSLLFDYPTLEALGRYLLEHVLELGDALPPSAAEVAGARTSSDEPIAVISMACRFPAGIDSPEALWRALAEGRDLVEEVPAERWDAAALYDPDPDALGKTYARQGGFVRDVDQFDPAFFEITPKEARGMDPQQRLLLETAWETLERAGVVPASLNGSVTGVYIGAFDSGYTEGATLEDMDGYCATGSIGSVASGRLAYTLGLQGPAITVDTACSSSLVALHLASQALRAGECDLALAGGVTLMLTPRAFVEFSRLRLVSPTSRCKSFSDEADGAGWSDGCGLVLLKRLSDAQRDGDRVLGVIRATAANQDGKSQGLSAPNGPAQERVIRRALALAGLAPTEVDYVEAHGTGTSLGDPIEANALAQVYGRGRPAGQPLWLGSLKSNFAHTQAAAGIAGVIKVVLSLLNEQLPKTLYSDKPSRHVDWEQSGLALVREHRPWLRNGHPRRAGVSAFGISGTNVHVILEEAPPSAAVGLTPLTAAEPIFTDAPLLLPLSARSEASLRTQALRLAEHLDARPELALPDLGYTLGLRRSHFERSVALVTTDRRALSAQLRALAAGEEPSGVAHRPARTRGKLVFVFPGHGPQWIAMGKALFERSPVFARALERCDAALSPHTGFSVLAVLRGEPGAPELERVDVVQPALFALTVALAALWRALGIEPDAVVGHSFGEIAAAHVAGALSLEEASEVVALRARAVAKLADQGGMAAVELAASELAHRLRERYAGRLELGAINSRSSSAVSGEVEALGELLAELEREQVFARKVRIRFASHSAQVEAARDAILQGLAHVHGRSSALPLYSTTLGAPIRGEELDAAFFYRNLREPVQFAAAIERLLGDGYRYFVEVSPHPLLRTPIEELAQTAAQPVVTVGSLRRDEDSVSCMYAALSELYAAGRELAWEKLLPAGGSHLADLPTYAFDRQRYVREPSAAPRVRSQHGPFLQVHLESSDQPGRHVFEAELDLADPTYRYLKDHRILGGVWLPGSALLEMALEAGRLVYPDAGAQLEDVKFERAVELSEASAVRLQLVLQAEVDAQGRRAFSFASRPAREAGAWLTNATGFMRVAETMPLTASLSELRARCTDNVDARAFYALLAEAGFERGPAFQGIESAARGEHEAVAKLASTPAGRYVVHPALLDAAFQSLTLPARFPSGRAYVPAAVASLRVHATAKPAWVTCTLRELEGDTALLDFTLFDEHERVVMEVRGFREVADSRLPQLLHEVQWQPLPAAGHSNGKATALPGPWLILADRADRTGVARALAERLGSARCVTVEPAAAFGAASATHYRVDPQSKADFARLLIDAFGSEPPHAIVHAWSLDASAIDSRQSLAEAERLCCASTLCLTQALAEMPWPRSPRLFLLTSGAQPACGPADVTHPAQALTWGFGASLAQEHPELGATLIDLDERAPASAALWNELLHPSDEGRVALRGKERLVPRLVKRLQRDAAQQPVQLRADRSYLVTGGLGGLGLVVAERLIALGARHLVLLGRRGATPEVETQLERLRAQGAQLHVVAADVSELASLAPALASVTRSAPAIAGVVHAAGVIDDATLLNLAPERLSKVIAPKAMGAALLAELLPDLELFVLFSSISGVFGSPGQAVYAAANAFLDAWAEQRRAAGKSALSLSWGPWSEVGMASDPRLRAKNLSAGAIDAIAPAEGAALLERSLSSARAHLVLVAFERQRLALLASALPILRELVATPRGEAGGDAIASQLAAASTVEARRALLERYLGEAVARVAGGSVAPNRDTALKELGLDSLMLLNLRNVISRGLSIELGTGKLLSLPTISQLAQYLEEALARGEGKPLATAHEPEEQQVVELSRWPATRDVLRLLRTEQQGTPNAAHNIGTAARLRQRCSPEQLEAVLAGIANRHAALRTAIVPDSQHGYALEVQPALNASLLRCSRLQMCLAHEREQGLGLIDDRLRALLEVPFAWAQAPLWRFELLEDGAGEQVLLLGAHHAVSDARSIMMVLAEIDLELGGRSLDRSVSNRDLVSLLRAQPLTAAEAEVDDATPIAWRKEFAGTKRLELTLASPRPSEPSFRLGGLSLPAPASLFERVATEASRLAVTPAALYMGVLSALIARVSGQSRFAVAVPVDTRGHADAEDAVGFFGVPVPLPVAAHLDETLTEIVQRTDRQFARVLQKGAAFANALPALVAEGLHRKGAPLIELFFNYINPKFSKFEQLTLLDVGAGYGDVDLMVVVAPQLGQVRLDFQTDILDRESCRLLGQAYLELLEQVTERLARTAEAGTVADVRLSAALERAARAARPASLPLAATFALGPLSEFLEASFREAGLPVAVAEAPYHQVLASLLDPSGVFAQPNGAAGIIMLRGVDLVRYRDDWSDKLLDELLEEYTAALSRLSQRASGQMPLVVGFLPDASGEPRFAAWDDKLAARLSKLPGLVVLRGDDWNQHYPVDERFAAEADALGHLPFSPQFVAAIALTLTRKVWSLRRRPLKVVAVDGDNTLWSGVAGELGPEAVDLSGPRAAFARKLLELRAAGVLLVLVSNNDEATVRQVLARPDSVLRAEHFSVISAAWDHKHARIARAAQKLNLGLDSFVFLDDNPVEIAGVRARLPEVMAITVPAVEELETFLSNLWALDVQAVTLEDRKRADFYREEQSRQELRDELDDFATFVEKLELQIAIEPLEPETLERSLQLSRRTNQFNLRPLTLESHGLRALVERPDTEVWTVSVRDRFGDYGLVGVLALERDAHELEVLCWLLSCRVLGRGVEERILHWLAERSERLERTQVKLLAEHTPRNIPARRLLAALGGGLVDHQRLEVTLAPERLRAFRFFERSAETVERTGDVDAHGL